MPKNKMPQNEYQQSQQNKQVNQNQANQSQINQKVPGANNYFETAEELANKGQKEHGAKKQAQNPEKGV